MTYETKLTKSHFGWNAKTDIVIGEASADHTGFTGQRILRIQTSKHHSGGISSMASVHVARDTCRGYSTETFALYGDFRQRCGIISDKRATEKNVRDIHAIALREIDDIIIRAKAFYATASAA